MHAGRLGRRDHGGGRRIGRKARDVLGDGALEQLHVLRQVTDVAAERLGRPLLDRGAVEPDAAARRRPHPDDGANQRRLAGGAGPDHADRAARFQREIDALHDDLLRAGRRDAQRLDGQRMRRDGQLEPHGRCRHRREQLAEPMPTLARGYKPLPIGDGEVDRRQGTTRQDRARDYDAGGRLLLDDEIGADAEHRRLQRHAQHASGRAQATGDVVHPLLLREVLAAEIEPAAAQRFGHSHCGEHVCVAPADFRQPAAQGCLRGGGFDGAARQEFGRERQRDQDDRPTQHGDADHDVKGEANGDVERNPRQVEQRGRTKPREKRPDRVEVAHRLQPVAAGPRPQRQPHDEIVNARPQFAIKLIADAHQQPAARDLQQGLKGEQHGGQGRQADQRRHAATRQDAVVDLQHEQRPGQHQEVDQPAEYADPDECGDTRTERITQLGFRTAVRRRFHHLRR